MYRAALEYILGFKIAGDRLRIDPCIPRGWREFEINYRRGNTTYRIMVENPHSLCRGVASVELDGVMQSDDSILLSNDGLTHEVRILIGEKIRIDEAEPLTAETSQQEQSR